MCVGGEGYKGGFRDGPPGIGALEEFGRIDDDPISAGDLAIMVRDWGKAVGDCIDRKEMKAASQLMKQVVFSDKFGEAVVVAEFLPFLVNSLAILKAPEKYTRGLCNGVLRIVSFLTGCSIQVTYYLFTNNFVDIVIENIEKYPMEGQNYAALALSSIIMDSTMDSFDALYQKGFLAQCLHLCASSRTIGSSKLLQIVCCKRTTHTTNELTEIFRFISAELPTSVADFDRSLNFIYCISSLLSKNGVGASFLSHDIDLWMTVNRIYGSCSDMSASHEVRNACFDLWNGLLTRLPPAQVRGFVLLLPLSIFMLNIKSSNAVNNQRLYALLETIVRKGPELAEILFNANLFSVILESYADLPYVNRRMIGELLVSVVLNRNEAHMLNLISVRQNIFEIWFDLVEDDEGYREVVIMALEAMCEKMRNRQRLELIKEKLAECEGMKLLSDFPYAEFVMDHFDAHNLKGV
jgi:hypothetical protein